MTDNLKAIRLGRFSRLWMTAVIGIMSRASNRRQWACLVFPMVAIVFAGTAHGAIISQYSFTDVVAGQLNRACDDRRIPT